MHVGDQLVRSSMCMRCSNLIWCKFERLVYMDDLMHVGDLVI